MPFQRSLQAQKNRRVYSRRRPRGSEIEMIFIPPLSLLRELLSYTPFPTEIVQLILKYDFRILGFLTRVLELPAFPSTSPRPSQRVVLPPWLRPGCPSEYQCRSAQGMVFLSLPRTHSIKAFKGRHLQTSWGGHGREPGQLNSPTFVLWHDSEVLVADSGNHRIQVFTLDGCWCRGWGELGAGPGQFCYPYEMWFEEGCLHVHDTLNRRVQVFI